MADAHQEHSTGMTIKDLWAILIIMLAPSALTLWWVIHQASAGR